MTDNRRAAWQHLAEAEYQMATHTDYEAVQAYAAMAQARALLALVDVLAATATGGQAEAEGPTPTPGRQGRFSITTDHLKAVVAIYRADTHAAPTRAVANHFNVSHSTAAKWIGAARRHELLPQTVNGFAAKGGAR